MKSHSTKMILGLGLAGLASGALALPCGPLLGRSALFAPGATFGLTIALFLHLFASERSVFKALLFSITSSASYIASLFATIFAYAATPHLGAAQSVDVPACIMIVGGAIGGFCVSAVALFLYSPERKRMLARTLWCSLAGVLLAIVGYAAGSFFEGPASTQNSGEIPGLVALLLVWPAGMGAVLGAALQLQPVTDDQGYWPGPYSFDTEPTASHEAKISQPRHVSVAGWTLIGLLCAGFVSLVARGVWTSHNFRRPSLDGLPPLEAMDSKDVLLDQPIAAATPSLRPTGRDPATINSLVTWSETAAIFLLQRIRKNRAMGSFIGPTEVSL